jgi:hypothetical protein
LHQTLLCNIVKTTLYLKTRIEILFCLLYFALMQTR